MKYTVPSGHAPLILCGIARARPNGKPTRVWFADWLGRPPSRGESAVLSRTLSRLEARGAVRRLAGRRVRMTAEGRRMAEPYLELLWIPRADLLGPMAPIAEGEPKATPPSSPARRRPRPNAERSNAHDHAVT